MGTFEVGFENRRPQAPHRDGDSVKYRLDVVASSPADVVGCVGGWLYDRVRAGWDVNVLLPQRYDSRPLQILGIRWPTLTGGSSPPARNTRPAAWRSVPTCSPPTRAFGRRCSPRWTAG